MAEVDHIEAALQQLLQERAELDAAIAALQKRSGKTASSAAQVPSANISLPAGDVIVYRGDFFNLSITKAAEKLLRRVGRALKTPEIQDAFQRAGYEIKSKLVRPTIYTSLNRSRDFVKVLPDTWDLSERHPEAAAQKEQEIAEQKTSKASKKRKARAHAEKGAVEALKTVA